MINKQQCQEIFENMTEGFALHKIITDKGGNPVDYEYIEVNSAFEVLTGLKKENVVGKRVTEVLPGVEKDPANLIGKYGKVAMTGKPIKFEDYLEPIKKWYLISVYSPKKDYFVTIFSDISDKKKIELDLRESEKKYRDLYDNSPVMFVNVDHDTGMVLNCNNTLVKKTGYSKEEIIGKHIIERYEGKKEAEAAFEEFVETGIITSTELRLKKKGGGHVDVLLDVTSVKDKDGKILYSRSVWQDITEKKQAEEALKESGEKFKSIVERTRDIFYMHNTEHLLKYVSPQCERIFGYSQKEMMVNWTTLTTDNVINKKGFGITMEALKTGKTQPMYNLEFRRKDGGIIMAEVDEAPLKDKSGKVIGMVGVLRDITERIKFEDELKKRNKELELINKVSVGRELKMVALKKRVKELEEKLKNK